MTRLTTDDLCRPLKDVAHQRWVEYREDHGIALDAPFNGEHPAVELLAELADAWNYAIEASRLTQSLAAQRMYRWAMYDIAVAHRRLRSAHRAEQETTHAN